MASYDLAGSRVRCITQEGPSSSHTGHVTQWRARADITTTDYADHVAVTIKPGLVYYKQKYGAQVRAVGTFSIYGKSGSVDFTTAVYGSSQSGVTLKPVSDWTFNVYKTHAAQTILIEVRFSVSSTTVSGPSSHSWSNENDYSTGRAPSSGSASSVGQVSFSVPALAKYTVSFNANGHGTAPASQSVYYGYKASTPTAPSASGYTFGGWYKEAACTNAWNFNSDTVTANTTLYAKWTVNKYTVTLDRQSGSGGSASVTATYNSAMPSATMPTRAGYYFGGYYDKTAGAGTQYYTANGASARAWDKASTATLYAKWTAYKATIRYQVNGGTVTTGTSTERWRASGGYLQRSTDSGSNWSTVTQNVATDTSYANMWNVGTPPITKIGYHVIGTSAWNTKADGSGVDLNQDYSASSATNAVTAARLNGGSALTKDITVDVYPKWVANTYTVIYNGNGETGGSTASSTHTYNVTKNLTANGFYRVGYSFMGWAVSPTGEKIYENTGAVLNLTATNNGTVNLYAVWSPNTYTYNDDDYQYIILSDSTVQVKVKDTSKTTYQDIPATFELTENGTKKTFTVTSLKECFSGCTQLEGEIFVEHAPTEYTNIFEGVINNVYVLSTASNHNHNTWKTIANSYDEISYLGADDNYSYTVISKESHTLAAQVLDTTKREYGPISKKLQGINEWTTTSLKECFKACTNMTVSPVIPETVIDMSNCFKNCNSLTRAPIIPSNVQNMSYCFDNCASLTTIEELPESVNNVAYCFNNCNNLQGNIIVNTDINKKRDEETVENVFSGTSLPIYIINGIIQNTSNSIDTIANTWRSIAENFDNVHYEADDIDFSDATFVVERKFYNDNSTDISFNNYVGSYISSSFTLLRNKIKNCPINWVIRWDGTDVEETMSGNVINTNKNIDNTDSTIFKFTDVSQFLLNNNEIILTITFIIDEIRQIEKTVEYRANLGAQQGASIIKIDYRDSDYIYTIITDRDEINTYEVAAYVINKGKTSYENLQPIQINNKTYLITSLHYPVYNAEGNLDTNHYVGWCYENCINLIAPPILPVEVLDLTNCFKGCTSLRGNLLVDNKPTAYTDMFTGTINDIYIINQGHADVLTWRDSIANSYKTTDGEPKNIHFEGNHNSNPRIVNINAIRGKLNIIPVYVLTEDRTINEDKTYYTHNQTTDVYEIVSLPEERELTSYYEKISEEWSWVSNDTEEWIRLEISSYLSNDYLPLGWVNQWIREFFVSFRDVYLQNELYIDPSSISYAAIQSKTIGAGMQYYGKINDIYRQVNVTTLSDPGYVLSNNLKIYEGVQYYQLIGTEYQPIISVQGTENPKQEGWYEQYNGDYYIKYYSPTQLIVYFKDWDDTLGTVQIGTTDVFGHEGSDTQKVYQIFAMLDFIPGGHGMAVGKTGHRNGLDIGLPTTIGDGLLPASEFTPTSERITGTTYYVLEGRNFIESENPTYRPVIGAQINPRETYYIYENGQYVQVPISTVIEYPDEQYYTGWYKKTSEVDFKNTQLIIGQYNIPLTDALFIIGNGTDEDNRSNLFVVYRDGYIEGGVTGVQIIRW